MLYYYKAASVCRIVSGGCSETSLSISVCFWGVRAGDKQPFNYLKAFHPIIRAFK